MKNKFEHIQNTKENIDMVNLDWQNIKLKFPNRTIRLGTSFSGIGAIEQALKQLNVNFKIQFAGDIDENCKKSYLANYDLEESHWHTDIHEFDATPYKGEVDLFVGGAPCQAFSLRGKHGGFEDTRGTLFREFARVVIECQPKVFIFENVKGMLTHDHGRTWKTIKETFEKDCNYDVYYQVLNGKDYGIPQSRDRIYCIGFKKETDFKYPAPIPLATTVYDYLEQSFSEKYFLKQKGVNFITQSINRKKSYTQINGDVQLCQKRNQQFNWHGDFIFHPILKSETANISETIFPTSTLQEGYYKDESYKYAVRSLGDKTYQFTKASKNDIDDSKGRFRKLTPRECLNLMGFSKSFKIVVSDTEIYKQSGNSIIVNVLIALLKKMDITLYGV